MARRSEVGTGHGVEHRGRVAYASGQHELAGEAAEQIAVIGTRRNTVARRFEPDQAVARRGDPNRSATVVAVGDGDNARRDRGARAAAGPSSAAPEIPRITHRAERTSLSGRVIAEFGRLSGAGKHEAGAPKAR